MTLAFRGVTCPGSHTSQWQFRFRLWSDSKHLPSCYTLPERLKNSSGGGPADHKPCHICVEARWNGCEQESSQKWTRKEEVWCAVVHVVAEELDMTWQRENNRAAESQGTWGRILTALFPGCVTSKKILTSLNCLLFISCGWYCFISNSLWSHEPSKAFPSL